jgi:hypothetical protein
MGLCGFFGYWAASKAGTGNSIRITSRSVLRNEKALIIDLWTILRGGEADAVELFLRKYHS